jgi:Alpha/beta hydrolase family
VQTRTRWLGALGIAVVAVAVAGLVGAPSIARAREPALPHPIQSAPYLVHERFRLHNGDGVIYSPNAMNYAARTDAAGPLLLFLPATRERPSNYTDFLTAARLRGFHVLALDYWNNGESVQKTCGADSKCYTEVQRNRLDGTRPSSFSAVDPPNSIVDRLTDAVRHLESSDPLGGWGRFVTRHGVDWRDIVVAGHSQGGGESAYIAHIHRVLGVLMFSSPVDSDNGVNASWMAHPGVTPLSRMYGFDDTRDIFAARIRTSWNAMGLGQFGAPRNVAMGIAPGSHELITKAVLGTPIESHSFDITDKTPRATNGQPIFEDVWKWMLDRVWTKTPIAIS